MGKAPIPANGDTPATASDWLIALGEQPANDELRARFEAWLAASPDHRRDWAEIARTAEALGQAEPAHRHEWGAFVRRRRAERGRPASRRVGRRRVGRLAASPLRHALPSSLAATSCCASRPTI